MSERQCIRVLYLIALLPVAMIGCGRVGHLPTVVTPPDDLAGAAPNVAARNEGMPETMRGRGHQHLPRRAVIAEAKEALGAVLTGEQVYLQWGTFTDVPDTADFRVTLGVYFGDLLRRWIFSVSDASFTGFVAMARGRPDTVAEGIVGTLRFVRGQPPSVVVVDARHDRGKKRIRGVCSSHTKPSYPCP